MSPRLNEELSSLLKYGKIKTELPIFIVNNLSAKFDLRSYQKEAIASFIFYFDNGQRQKPTQLLFHMATGSGKTIIMAAQILYLHQQGYRNFIFFVNSTNIIEKTKNNFINKLSSKYLFADKITFADKRIEIKEVKNFESTNKDDIHILFATIQGLHTTLNSPQENSVTFEDFKDKKIILLSDEAHHINTMTMNKLSNEEQYERNSWEGTVNKIFKSNSDNLLLEFTATTDFEHPAIRAKYEDKVLYDYPLKQFRQDGYSKEVKVLESDIPPMDRALQAIILSQHRRKVAEKNKIHLKPVILMKSKFIRESEEFENKFYDKIRHLKSSDLERIKVKSKNSVLQRAFDYFEKNNISLENLVTELKEDFGDDKCISVNSMDESDEKQILVNTLEDKDNEIRVIFAVDKLNEGWDVLNLFDIVRLYETRDVKDGKPGNTTIREAQLIGRGARYFPFQLADSDNKFKRKFDSDVENELRVIEELYYHSSYNPRYIQELNQALRESGIIPERTKEVQVRIKDDFKKTKFWKSGHLFMNKKIINDRSNVKDFSDIQISSRFKYTLHTGRTRTAILFESENSPSVETTTNLYRLGDLGKTILQKAIYKFDFYQFSNLKSYFPKLDSINNFVTSKKYLANIEVEVTGLKEQLENLKAEEKLDIATFVLESISPELQKGKTEYVGTKEFVPIPLEQCIKDKTLNIPIENGDKEAGIAMSETTSSELNLDLSDKNWYIYNDNYGTSEEKYLIKLLHNVMAKLKSKFKEVYLLRNERLFQIYRFSDGRALEPDFVLFLKDDASKTVLYQLFIEPKGEHLLGTDKWKEDFLETIESEYVVTTMLDNNDFRIIGMPFYNEKITKTKFLDKFENVLKVKMRE